MVYYPSLLVVEMATSVTMKDIMTLLLIIFTLHIRDIAAAGYSSDAGYAFEQLNSIEFKDRDSADDMMTNVPIAIDTKTVIHTTSEKFLSMAIDAGIMLHKWETFDIR